MDAQMAINELSEKGFRILNDISISPNKYIYDLSYAGHSKVNVAVETHDSFDFSYSDNIGIGRLFHIASYLCNFDSSGDVFLSLERTIKTPNHNYYNHARQCSWFPIHLTNGYIPHGIAKCKSTAKLLISLWNHKPRKHSQGKIWKLIPSNQKFCEYEYDKSRPLFKCPTYITENGNGDICVSDEGAVVVLNEVGMFRFRYKGLTGDKNFDPYGICADSALNIIIADMRNEKIHMIDENGGYVCYIQYENMEMPRALCIGENDVLYVGEWKSGKVKVISPM